MCRCIAIFALALSQIALVSAASGLRGGENISLSETVDRSLIIGGKNAVSGDYPYFAHFDSPGCGGSLIAPDLVLTAGHVSAG
jgi:secreted trypsin-like serine protease